MSEPGSWRVSPTIKLENMGVKCIENVFRERMWLEISVLLARVALYIGKKNLGLTLRLSPTRSAIR